MLLPHLFTDLLSGRGREVHSQKANKLPKGSTSQYFFYFFFLCKFHIFLNIRAICGSAEQPLLGPSEKALNQSKPHPSNRTV